MKAFLIGLIALLVVTCLVMVCIAYPLATFLVVPLLIAALAWLFKSIGSVGKDEVAVRVWWGDPEEKVNHSGLVFVPWFFGIRFDGRTLCELVRITTKQIPFNFKNVGGQEEQLIWSEDRIALLVDLTGYARFPFKEPKSLCLMIRAGVPLTKAEFAEWARPEIVSGLRDILAKYNHKQAIARSNLEHVRADAQEFFLREEGLFAKSGICGNDSHNFDEGTGEVIVRIDIVKTDEDLRKAMASPVVAGYEAEAAVNKAKVEGLLAGGPHDVLMDQWIVQQAEKRNVPREADGSFNKEKLAELVAELKKDGSYMEQSRIYKELILADSGNLQVSQVLFGSPDGKPLPANLQFLSIGGGQAGAGVFFGSKRGGGNPASGQGGGQQGGQAGQGGKSVAEGAQEFFDKHGIWPPWGPLERGKQLAEEFFQKHGKYPPWDPLKRGKGKSSP